MEAATTLLEPYSEHAWVLKSTAYRATVHDLDVGLSGCLCASNRPTHEILPGTLFVDAAGHGMLLIVPFGALRDERHQPTHEVVFAFTHPDHRRHGVLRRLMRAVPSSWHLWLESSTQTERVWTSLGCARRTTRSLRSMSADWDESLEMERLPTLHTDAHASVQPRIVVVG